MKYVYIKMVSASLSSSKEELKQLGLQQRNKTTREDTERYNETTIRTKMVDNERREAERQIKDVHYD